MEETKNDPTSQKGGVLLLLLSLFLLILFTQTVLIFLLHQKTNFFRTQLTEVQENKKNLENWKRKALLSLNAANTLKGWKTTSPLVFPFLEKLQAPGEGLKLSDLGISRYLVLKSLSERDQDPLFSETILAFFLFDDVEFSICETEPGSGILTFPRFLSRLNKNMEHPLEYERTSCFSPYTFQGDKSAPNLWSFSSDFPVQPLWINALELDQ